MAAAKSMEFIALAQQCAPTVAPQTLAAIVKQESGFRPLTIGINGGARLERQPANVGEAVATAKWLIEKGYNIDLGLGQINVKNVVKMGLSIEDTFDPCKNLAASAQILTENFQGAKRSTQNDQVALRAALSMYNTGSYTRGFENGYVQNVLAKAGDKAPNYEPIPLARSNSVGTARKTNKTARANLPMWAPVADHSTEMVYR
jgi:type IV secretion system protein VirB1